MRLFLLYVYVCISGGSHAPQIFTMIIIAVPWVQPLVRLALIKFQIMHVINVFFYLNQCVRSTKCPLGGFNPMWFGLSNLAFGKRRVRRGGKTVNIKTSIALVRFFSSSLVCVSGSIFHHCPTWNACTHTHTHIRFFVNFSIGGSRMNGMSITRVWTSNYRFLCIHFVQMKLT